MIFVNTSKKQVKHESVQFVFEVLIFDAVSQFVEQGCWKADEGSKNNHPVLETPDMLSYL